MPRNDNANNLADSTTNKYHNLYSLNGHWDCRWIYYWVCER